MPKRFKFQEGDELQVKENCRRGYPSMPGKKVIIHRQMNDSVQFDYEAISEHERHVLYRFKEEELEYPAPYKEEIS